MRDILRYVVSASKEFAERKKPSDWLLRKSMNAPKHYSLDLFISHSSKDKNVAAALVEFLRAALAIPHERVRCTSVDGYKLSAGATTEAELRREIHQTHCFIGLVTPASLQSQFVLFELGARWGSGEHLVPLLAEGKRAGDLGPPLSSLNALDCASEQAMQQLVHDLARVLKKNVPLPTIYKAQLSRLLNTQKTGFTFFG